MVRKKKSKKKSPGKTHKKAKRRSPSKAKKTPASKAERRPKRKGERDKTRRTSPLLRRRPDPAYRPCYRLGAVPAETIIASLGLNDPTPIEEPIADSLRAFLKVAPEVPTNDESRERGEETLTSVPLPARIRLIAEYINRAAGISVSVEDFRPRADEKTCELAGAAIVALARLQVQTQGRLEQLEYDQFATAEPFGYPDGLYIWALPGMLQDVAEPGYLTARIRKGAQALLRDYTESRAQATKSDSPVREDDRLTPPRPGSAPSDRDTSPVVTTSNAPETSLQLQRDVADYANSSCAGRNQGEDGRRPVNTVTRSGGGWNFVFDGKRQYFPHRKWLSALQLLLLNPGRRYTCEELAKEAEPKELDRMPIMASGAPPDGHSIEEYRAALDQLKTERVEAEARSDIEAIDDLDRKILHLEREIARGTGRNRENREDSDPNKLLRDRVQKGLRTCRDAFSDSLPELFEHLNKDLKFYGIEIEYRPSTRTRWTA